MPEQTRPGQNPGFSTDINKDKPMKKEDKPTKPNEEYRRPGQKDEEFGDKPGTRRETNR